MKKITVKRPSKRLILIASGVAAVAVIGLYTWQSVAYWQGFEARLTTEGKELKGLKTTAISADTSKERLAAIRTLDDRLATRVALCDTSALYGWQANVVPILHDGVAQCEKAVKQLDVIAGPLGELRSYLDVGVELQAALRALAPGQALTEKNWAELGVERAKAAQKAIQAIKAKGDSQTLQKRAETLAGNLVNAWEKLNKANQAKDKLAFLVASAEVVKAYADFAGLADESDEAVKTKADKLIKVADTLTLPA